MKSENSSAEICLEPFMAAAQDAPQRSSLDARLQEILNESWKEFERENSFDLGPAPPVKQRGQKHPGA